MYEFSSYGYVFLYGILTSVNSGQSIDVRRLKLKKNDFQFIITADKLTYESFFLFHGIKTFTYLTIPVAHLNL